MKNERVNLHMDQKRACVIMLSFSLMLTIVGVLTVLSVRNDFSQLSSLLRSDYEYSAISKDTFIQDDYLKFDAGIGFSTSAKDQSSINAEILMQSNSTQYTEIVDWNTEKLSTYGIAITKGLARRYGIEVGDFLYSKHIVNGKDYEYVIEQILPEITSIRMQSWKSFSEGIIIMGCDDRYVDNLVHLNIIYTKVPIDELASSVSDMPINIVYRTEEILSVIKNIVPYLLFFLILSILISCSLVISLTKEVIFNIKRMIMLGFDIESVNTSFRKLIFEKSFLAIGIAFILLALVAYLTGLSITEGIYMLVELGVESASILIMTRVIINRLWR